MAVSDLEGYAFANCTPLRYFFLTSVAAAYYKISSAMAIIESMFWLGGPPFPFAACKVWHSDKGGDDVSSPESASGHCPAPVGNTSGRHVRALWRRLLRRGFKAWSPDLRFNGIDIYTYTICIFLKSLKLLFFILPYYFNILVAFPCKLNPLANILCIKGRILIKQCFDSMLILPTSYWLTV